jgi:RNA polymerase sigma factor (sigma-70 family)
VALTRRGHHGAFETLVQRYQSRLLAFCRHMLGSQEDAEDVLQEVFAAAFNAICADERHINARPWLYRIARNRCLNHLRRPRPAGQDSMDVFERDGGSTTADTVHKREEFRHIVADVQDLPETQRTALLLREIDALSYDQIADAMDTTVPSVKSLLVRARVSLAEAAESRLLTCEEVRLELGQVAEGLAKTSPPVRRHLRHCQRCRTFRTELRKSTRALAAIYPIGPLVVLKKLWLTKVSVSGTKLGLGGASAAGGGGAAAGGAGVAGGAAGGISAGGAVSAGVGTVATKAVAGMAAAALVTAGAVEVRQAATTRVATPRATTAPHRRHAAAVPDTRRVKVDPTHKDATPSPTTTTSTTTTQDPTATQTSTTPTTPTVQTDSSTVTLDQSSSNDGGASSPPPGQTDTSTTSQGDMTTQPAPPPAPPSEPKTSTTPTTTSP